jgi:hypothetical protein
MTKKDVIAKLVGGFMFFIMSMLWSNGVKEVGANKEEVATVYLAKDKYLHKIYL